MRQFPLPPILSRYTNVKIWLLYLQNKLKDTVLEDRSSEGCRDHLTGADKLNLPIIKSYSKVNINNVEYVLVDVTLNATVEIVLNTYSDDNEENAQQRESSLFDNNTNHPGQKTPQSESCLVDLVNDQERSKEGSKLVYHCHVSNCKTVFTNITHYKEHVRKHLEVKPFICSWENCNLSFCRLHELTRHKRLHLGLKPYKCELCEAKFTRSDHLLNHKRSKHKEIFVV